MSKRVLVLDGHPDPETSRLCHALADAYAEGARDAGHDVTVVRLADMEVALLGSKKEFEDDVPAEPLRRVQESIKEADHLVLIYPLWLGTMPAKLKALLEQVLRPGFAFALGDGALWRKQLSGRSARIVVTMGMPAFFYRWYFRAHSLKSLERNILKFCGIKPVRETLLGMVEGVSDTRRRQWLEKLRELGAAAR